MAAAVTALAVLFGTAAALTTERTRAPARRALRLAVLLPLVVPGFVAALSWARAYGPSGLIEDLGGPALPGLFGALGVVAVLTAESVPLAYLVVAAALASRSEAEFERAARASGATPAQALRTVTLPLLRPALTAAASLVFITSVNAFGVPAVLGLPGGFSTLTTRIYADLALSADPRSFTRAVALSAGLVLVSGAAVAFVDAAGARRIAVRVGSSAGGTVLDPVRWPGVALWACLTFAVGVPLLALILTAVTRAAGLPPVPENWTLANFATALDPSAAGALGRSVVLAGLTERPELGHVRQQDESEGVAEPRPVRQEHRDGEGRSRDGERQRRRSPEPPPRPTAAQRDQKAAEDHDNGGRTPAAGRRSRRRCTGSVASCPGQRCDRRHRAADRGATAGPPGVGGGVACGLPLRHP